MTLNQLICRAASVYPDTYVLEYWDLEKQEPRSNPEGGDTLAQFIAQELASTYDEEDSEQEQVATAIRVMESAAADLSSVARAIRELQSDRQAA